MKPRIVYNEDFLSERIRFSCNLSLNCSLPLRLQKRQILGQLGFPIDLDIYPVKVTRQAEISRCYRRFIEKRPFIIIVSEKPMETLCTPFFIVRDENNVLYRDADGRWNVIFSETIPALIGRYSKQSWIEFALPLWDEKAIAGKLIYFDSEKQFIEMQQAVIPAKIAYSSEFKYFSSELESFDCDSIFTFQRLNLRDMGYKKCFARETIEALCLGLSYHRNGFEELKKISFSPTVEFAYFSETNRFIVVDVDWPAQWPYWRQLNGENRRNSFDG